MRIHFVASVSLALALVACGSPKESPSASQVITCANAGAAHRAYVVVEHLSGASFERCVGFEGPMIDGQALMDQSGVQYGVYTLSSGKAVCQVDNEPKQYSQCFPLGQPYWALFVETHGTWASAPAGFADVKLHDGEALGWHYVPASDPSPAPPPLV